MFMKKLLSHTLLLVALVFGFSSAASAEHCIVRQHDSMWKIAKRYNVSFQELLKLNKHYVNQDLIHPNDKIELPSGSTGAGTSTGSHEDDIESQTHSIPEHGISDMAHAILLLVNNERSKQGLNKLTLSDTLTPIATLKSKDMADKNYFSHTSPTYGSPFEMLQKYGVSYKSAGENIAAGQKTANEVMNSWMNSSGHRANILNSKYTELGVGYYVGGSYGTYWTQMFIEK